MAPAAACPIGDYDDVRRCTPAALTACPRAVALRTEVPPRLAGCDAEEVVAVDASRWTEVSPSQFTHEAEGLHYVRGLLPSAPPFRAWSNFEFRDDHGKWHEVDLLVLGRRRLHLVELKWYRGTIGGTDVLWKRNGNRPGRQTSRPNRPRARRRAAAIRDL